MASLITVKANERRKAKVKKINLKDRSDTQVTHTAEHNYNTIGYINYLPNLPKTITLTQSLMQQIKASRKKAHANIEREKYLVVETVWRATCMVNLKKYVAISKLDAGGSILIN